MTNSNRYFSILLFAFFLLYALVAAGGDTSEKIICEGAVAQERAIPSYHFAERAGYLSLQAHGSPVFLGNSQLNARLSKGKFLVASRKIRDPRFMETVIFLVQHDSNGAAGLIINRPTTVGLSEVLPEIKKQDGREHLAYIGGPVSMNQISLLIHSKEKIEGSEQILDDVYLSSSKSTLERLIKNAPKKTRFNAYAGYAGWIAGQLEHEVSRGDWHVMQSNAAAAIFDQSPLAIWPDLIQKTETIRI